MKIEFNKQNDIVVASTIGKAGVAEIVELINASVALCIKQVCFRILFDMTEVEESFSFMEEYELNKNLIERTNLSRDFRCAVVFIPSKGKTEDDLKFKETVANNWHQSIFRIFFDKKKGVEWLKLHTTKAKPNFG